MIADIKDGGSGPKKSLRTVDAVAQFSGFYTNDHHTYAARKAERLASAVHIVTGFVNQGEPIRTTLRSLSIEITQLSTDPTRLVGAGLDSFGARCAEVGSLLETAESAGLVSPMNAKLIVEEYAKLAQFVRERFGLFRRGSVDMYKGQKDTTPYRTDYRTHEGHDARAIADTHGSRTSDILRVFESKEPASIKDVAASVAGVSEKTIQRELLALVAKGTLVKEGERRWSVYRRARVEGAKSDLQ